MSPFKNDYSHLRLIGFDGLRNDFVEGVHDEIADRQQIATNDLWRVATPTSNTQVTTAQMTIIRVGMLLRPRPSEHCWSIQTDWQPARYSVLDTNAARGILGAS